MAFEDFDDYEKSEYVANWLRQNAAAIISGLAIGLLLIFGINQWRQHRVNHQAEAAAQYEALTTALQDDKAKAATLAATTLQDEYKDTAFAVFSALQQAAKASKDGDHAAAVRSLNWAQQYANNPALKALARLRLARVQLAAGQAAESVKTLDSMPAGAYVGLTAELRGDALLAQGQNEAARTAYQSALDHYTADGAPSGLVQLKLDNLAGAPVAKPEAATTTPPAPASTATPSGATTS